MTRITLIVQSDEAGGIERALQYQQQIEIEVQYVLSVVGINSRVEVEARTETLASDAGDA